MAEINLSIKAETAEELDQLLHDLATRGTVVNVADPHVSEKKEVKKPKKAKVSSDSTSAEEPSKTGEQVEPTDAEPEKSITQGQHPNATKADVQKSMKEALEKGKREEIKTAFGRFNADKLSELKEEDYSAFLTDLEVLVGE